jgi:hypothetical protein
MIESILGDGVSQPIDLVCMYVCMYLFVGAGFPMHRDLIWSIVRPL